MAKHHIQQDTFDECVRENMTEFDMALEESIQDSIQQFASQEVDLSTIVTDNLLESNQTRIEQTLSTIESIKSLITETDGRKKHVSDKSAFSSHLESLIDWIKASPALKLLLPNIDLVPQILELTFANESDTDSKLVEKAVELIVLTCDSQYRQIQSAIGEKIIPLLLDFLTFCNRVESMSRSLAILTQICSKNESNKLIFMQLNGHTTLFKHVFLVHENMEFSKQFAKFLRGLMAQDDMVELSQSDAIVKQLMQLDLIPFSLKVIRERLHCTEDRSAVILWLAVLRQMAISEANCMQIYQEGNLDVLYDMMDTYASNALTAKQCVALLRNLAGVDTIKHQILKTGGITRVLHAMQTHVMCAFVQKHSCAFLAATALREPECAAEIVRHQGAFAIARAMRKHSKDGSMLRQASLAIRNIVARSPEFQKDFLDEGIEAMLRGALDLSSCQSEAYGALRDLNCETPVETYRKPVKLEFNPVQTQSRYLE
uniref:Uncharacterized protein AlNc14C153G7561 n=1 Tax=Albugo laibachii Nc14 TaxID=890382 RepID=F0WM58_9STRA|nr:conserved hypothetical protein [Albugo laibachii Nc14]|eukprot:CCA22386.1 conserved hypothetical protein [Albugo laibachii Nc14]